MDLQPITADGLRSKSRLFFTCVEAVNLIASDPVSLLVVGDKDAPTFPKELLPYTTRTDLNGGGIRVNFLVNYGWEWDLAKFAFPRPESSENLQPAHSHDISRVDLVIRWGGMRRPIRLFACPVRLRRLLCCRPAMA